MDRLHAGVRVLRPHVPVQRLEQPHSRHAGRLFLLRLVELGGQRDLIRTVHRIDDRNAAVAGHNNGGRRQPLAAHERQVLRLQLEHCAARAGLGHVDRAVMADPANLVAVAGEADAVNPAAALAGILELGHQLAERHPVAPGRRRRLALHVLDVGGEDARLVVGGARDEQHIVRMPVERRDGRADRLFDVLRHPPIVLRLKVADGDEAGARAHGQLILQRRPLDARRAAIDAQQHQRRLPFAVRAQRPNVRVPVDGTGDDSVGVGRPVDAHHAQIMLSQNVQQRPVGAAALINVHFGVVRRNGDF